MLEQQKQQQQQRQQQQDQQGQQQKDQQQQLFPLCLASETVVSHAASLFSAGSSSRSSSSSSSWTVFKRGSGGLSSFRISESRAPIFAAAGLSRPWDKPPTDVHRCFFSLRITPRKAKHIQSLNLQQGSSSSSSSSTAGEVGPTASSSAGAEAATKPLYALPTHPRVGAPCVGAPCRSQGAPGWHLGGPPGPSTVLHAFQPPKSNCCSAVRGPPRRLGVGGPFCTDCQLRGAPLNRWFLGGPGGPRGSLRGQHKCCQRKR